MNWELVCSPIEKVQETIIVQSTDPNCYTTAPPEYKTSVMTSSQTPISLQIPLSTTKIKVQEATEASPSVLRILERMYQLLNCPQINIDQDN